MIIHRNFFLMLFGPLFFAALRLSIFALIPLFSLFVFFALMVGSALPERLVWFTNDFRVGVIDVERGMLAFYPASMPLRPDLPVGEIAIPTGQIIRTFTRDLMPAFSRAMPVGNLPMTCEYWSPNAEYLLCESQWNGIARIWVFDAYSGHQPILRIDDSLHEINAVFSPDSQRLAAAFSDLQTQLSVVYVYPLPEGDQRFVAEYPATTRMFLEWSDALRGTLFSVSDEPQLVTVLQADTPAEQPPLERISIDRQRQRDYWLNQNELLLLTIQINRHASMITFQLEYLRLDPPERRTIYTGTELQLFRMIGIQFGDEYTILP